MIEGVLAVPADIRTLAAKSMDHMELAFSMMFASAEMSIDSSSEPTFALLQKTVGAKMEFGRKLAQARDLRETTAAHSAFLRAQIAIAGDLIKMNHR